MSKSVCLFLSFYLFIYLGLQQAEVSIGSQQQATQQQSFQQQQQSFQQQQQSIQQQQQSNQQQQQSFQQQREEAFEDMNSNEVIERVTEPPPRN